MNNKDDIRIKKDLSDIIGVWWIRSSDTEESEYAGFVSYSGIGVFGYIYDDECWVAPCFVI